MHYAPSVIVLFKHHTIVVVGYLTTTTVQKTKNMISTQYFRNTSGMFGHSVMNVMMNNELDFVRLNASENGCCCGMHAVCGQQVVARMAACFCWVQVVVEGRDEMD